MKRLWMSLAMYPIVTGYALATPVTVDTSRLAPGSTTSVEPHPTLDQEKDAWAKIMRLLSLHNGYATSAEFEDIFNVKLKDIGTDPLKNGAVSVHGRTTDLQETWPLVANVLEFSAKDGSKWSSINIIFRDKFSPRAANVPCLDITPLFEELNRSGWPNSGPFMPGTKKMSDFMEAYASNPHNQYIVRIVTDVNQCLDSVVIMDRTRL